MKIYLLFALLFFNPLLSLAQICCGTVYDNVSKDVLAYVNIGVVDRDKGTVSDIKGCYSLDVSEITESDSVRFSYIGYTPFIISVGEFKHLSTYDIYLEPQTIGLEEVIVKAAVLENKRLGNRITKSKIFSGFEQNNKGYELGVLLNIKKRAFLEKLYLHVGHNSYDSIFYRINIYKKTNGNSFTNILRTPIYYKANIGKGTPTVSIDLKEYNIVAEGKTLITLEHIEDLGEGGLYFRSSLKGSTSYYRKTSQGKWVKAPIKIGISVDAQVEK